MSFKIKSSPYIHNQKQTSYIMKFVCLATIPGIFVQFYFFGWGTLIQICLGCTSAIFAETVVLKLRKMKISHTLGDNSALLTGLLLAVSIPPLSPWWMIVLGSMFSIIIAKQIYGGLGNNLFNPAMIGYVVLLISFPLQMTKCLLSYKSSMVTSNFIDVLNIIFKNHVFFDNIFFNMNIDGISQATPLEIFKTSFHAGFNIKYIMQNTPYKSIMLINKKWQLINLAYLLGGLFLLQKKIIKWHIPISFLCILTICASFGYFFSPQFFIPPKIHLLSGATMFGAFFILTDPVTASTTNLGRLIFGALAGFLVWLIRSFGIYPDSVAFSVLLANLFVPLIDHLTKKM